MLPMPRDQVAAQEYVGEWVTKDRQEVWDKSPTKDRWVWFALDEEVCAEEPAAEPTKQDQRAPIKMVSRRVWPGDLPGSKTTE